MDVDVGLASLDVNNFVPIGNVELNNVSSRVGPAEVDVLNRTNPAVFSMEVYVT